MFLLIDYTSFARRKGSKDRNKRKRRLLTYTVGGAALGGLLAGGVGLKLTGNTAKKARDAVDNYANSLRQLGREGGKSYSEKTIQEMIKSNYNTIRRNRRDSVTLAALGGSTLGAGIGNITAKRTNRKER